MRIRGAFVFKVHGGPMTMAGLPDITGSYRGRSVWVETKMPAGTAPTPIQQHRHTQIRAAGGAVLVARSVADVTAWLDQLSATLPAVDGVPGHDEGPRLPEAPQSR